MFTGIVEKISQIKKISRKSSGFELVTLNPFSDENPSTGDSISVNGVCLTVNYVDNNIIKFDVMPVTYLNTAISCLKIGDYVNFERALKAQGRFDGHIVTGHVDYKSGILKISKNSKGVVFRIKLDKKNPVFAVLKGSIAVNGVSLTIQKMEKSFFEVNLIPETLNRTVFKFLKQNEYVNIEYDILMKKNSTKNGQNYSESYLKSLGYGGVK